MNLRFSKGNSKLKTSAMLHRQLHETYSLKKISILMVTLGADISSLIFNELSEEYSNKITLAISRLDEIPNTDRYAVFIELYSYLVSLHFIEQNKDWEHRINDIIAILRNHPVLAAQFINMTIKNDSNDSPVINPGELDHFNNEIAQIPGSHKEIPSNRKYFGYNNICHIVRNGTLKELKELRSPKGESFIIEYSNSGFISPFVIGEAKKRMGSMRVYNEGVSKGMNFCVNIDGIVHDPPWVSELPGKSGSGFFSMKINTAQL
ncbi:MAG: hypothetical protein GY754_23840 [bacterium]|nr:hypothetical protein [bacterium]